MISVDVVEQLLKAIETVHGTEEALRWRRIVNIAKTAQQRDEIEMTTKQELTDENEALRAKNEHLARLLAEHDVRDASPVDETALATTGQQIADTPLNQLALAMGISDEHMEDGERVQDAMAKAIEHDRKIREEMRSALAAARLVINRLASIMGVQKWDADGSELIEKAQRWVGFAGDLKRRIKALETATIGSYGANCLRYARIEEVTAMYARFMGTGDLAQWLATIPSDVSTVAMMDAAEPLPPGLPENDPEDGKALTMDDVRDLVGAAVAAVADGVVRPIKADTIFARMETSAVAMQTLAQVINLVILPHLRKIGA